MANYQFKLTGDEIANRLGKVTTLESSVSTMGGELHTVTDEVDKHDSRLDTAETTIKAQEEKLESTINDVATNAKGIADNKTAIGTNATNIATNKANIATNTEAIAALEEKTPTMWANVLAVKDTAITVDGQRVELPAYTNVVIKDFKTFALATNTPNPKCIKKFDIHYNGIAKVHKLNFSLTYKPTDETVSQWYGLELPTIDISLMDASEMTSLAHIFHRAQVQTIDMSGWDTSSVTDMQLSFAGEEALTSLNGLSGWDVGRVETLHSAFAVLTNLKALNLNGWKLSACTDLMLLFYGCKNLTDLDVSNWTTARVMSFRETFAGCSSLPSLDLSSWDTTAATNTYIMFYGCSSLTDITFGEGFGKATASGLTLDLSYCGSSKSYQLTDNTYNTMLTMYDRATNGLPTMTIKFNAKHNLPDGFIAAMTARGYVISQ